MTVVAPRPASRPAAPRASSAPNFADHAAAIESEMQLASRSLSVATVLRIEERFALLRELAAKRPAEMSPQLDRLRTLRERFEALKTPLAKELVDDLHRTRGLIQDAQAREQALRNSLIWLSRSIGRERLDGREAAATVQTTQRYILPEAGTPDRRRLEALVTQHDLWPEVALLQGPRLGKAIQAGRFAGQHAAELSRLVPRTNVSVVRSFASGRER
jgi:hypothetical protein